MERTESERKQAEEALRESENKYRNMVKTRSMLFADYVMVAVSYEDSRMAEEVL